MIDPAGIPVIAGDMDVLAGHGATLSGVGAAFADTGARIHTGWQGLGAVYRAPEAGLLLAATGPVAAVSASVGEDITAVGAALSVYAAEVAVIKTRLASLRTQAVTFVDTVAAIDDWRADAHTVEDHNQLVSGVNAAVAEFMDAQRRCANTILALYTDRRYSVDNGYPGFDKGQLGAVLTDAGKAIIAYDEWEHDPSRAAGMATTNILTTILGTKRCRRRGQRHRRRTTGHPARHRHPHRHRTHPRR